MFTFKMVKKLVEKFEDEALPEAISFLKIVCMNTT